MEPSTRLEIHHSLESAEELVTGFFGTLYDAEFYHREGDAWSPEQHLRHLNASVEAVGRALLYPRFVLRIRFGRGAGRSRSYAEVRELYEARLAAGGKARGRFAPAAIGDHPPADHRHEVLERWRRLNLRLRESLARWKERDLDRIQLPHPLLGMLTVREILFFTIHHNQHHIVSAARRLPAGVQAG
jgi:hypothetical protein